MNKGTDAHLSKTETPFEQALTEYSLRLQAGLETKPELVIAAHNQEVRQVLEGLLNEFDSEYLRVSKELGTGDGQVPNTMYHQIAADLLERYK